MAGRGTYGDLDKLRGPQREFAVAVRELFVEAAGGEPRTLRELSKMLRIPKNRLSDLANAKVGKRGAATIDYLTDLHNVASALASGKPLQVTLDSLLLLHQQVRQLVQEIRDGELKPGMCANCPAGTARAASAPAIPSADHEPADAPQHESLRDMVLPVPTPTGDRPFIGLREWPGMDDLHTRLAAGEFADAAGILRHTGSAAAAPETAAAIAACYRRGLHEAADTMLVYAAQRTGRDVMQIAKALLDNDHPSGANELLKLTLAL